MTVRITVRRPESESIMDNRNIDPNAEPTIELTIPSHPRFLQLVRGVITKVTDILSIPTEVSDYIILAVDEACSNIIRHSYMGNACGKIELLIVPGKKQLKIDIMDYGMPWTPARLPREPGEPLKIKPGGLGLYIIHQVMDQVKYHRSDKDQNTISMVKNLDEGDRL